MSAHGPQSGYPVRRAAPRRPSGADRQQIALKEDRDGLRYSV